MNGQIQLVGLDWGEMCNVDIHDLILDEVPQEPVGTGKKTMVEDAPEWEVVFSSGADIAIRRRKGRNSSILALIVGKDQLYLWDECKDSRVPATASRISSFFKGCTKQQLIPWFAGDLEGVSGKRARTLVELLENKGFNALLRRGLVTLDRAALAQMGRRNCYDGALAFMSEYEDRQHAFKVVLTALLKHYPKDEVASFLSRKVGASAVMADSYYKMNSTFDYLRYVCGILEALGLDSTRKILDAVIESADENATALYTLADALSILQTYDVAYEPKVLARYAASHIDFVSEWKNYVQRALWDNHFIDHLYPRDPQAAYEDYCRRRTEARNLGLQQRFSNRIAMLGSKEYDNGKYLIRLPRSSSELEDEGSRLHHCVRRFVERHATMKTTIWFMRLSADPETPFITIQVDGGSMSGELVQVHGLMNRNANDDEAAFIREWAKRSGYKYDRQKCNQMVG